MKRPPKPQSKGGMIEAEKDGDRKMMTPAQYRRYQQLKGMPEVTEEQLADFFNRPDGRGFIKPFRTGGRPGSK